MPTFNTPGVYIQEQTAGYIPTDLASHKAVYMVGTSSQAGAPNVPTFIQDITAFENAFGTSSPSYKHAQLFFAQRARAGFYFLNVASRPTRTVDIDTVTTGTTYTLTIAGVANSVTAATGDTEATLLAKLRAAVNQSVGSICYMDSANKLVYITGTTITASSGVTLGTETAAGASPTPSDVAAALASNFTTEYAQGFLLAPEFFQSYTDSQKVQDLAAVLEAHCQDPRFLWVALIDAGSHVATASNVGTALGLALSEKAGIVSPKGFSWYYFPYWVNISGQVVAQSPAVAGVAIRRYDNEDINQPVAGAQYQVYGVSKPSLDVDDLIQAQLNPKGINVCRKIPGVGNVIWGARTTSSDPYYRFGNVRVILNVLEGTLRNSFGSLIFSAVDGLGVVFGRIKGTAVSICDRLEDRGALFRDATGEAYRVICDLTNNDPADLESGYVYVDVYVKPAPTLEVLVVRVSRTSIGTNFDEIIGDRTDTNL